MQKSKNHTEKYNKNINFYYNNNYVSTPLLAVIEYDDNAYNNLNDIISMK